MESALNRFDCTGNVRLFFEITPISYLKLFNYVSFFEPAEDAAIVDAGLENFGRTITNLNLKSDVSSANLIKISESCSVLEKLTL
jgi:hypothetical protein